jgi:hypothetical protein
MRGKTALGLPSAVLLNQINAVIDTEQNQLLPGFLTMSAVLTSSQPTPRVRLAESDLS